MSSSSGKVRADETASFQKYVRRDHVIREDGEFACDATQVHQYQATLRYSNPIRVTYTDLCDNNIGHEIWTCKRARRRRSNRCSAVAQVDVHTYLWVMARCHIVCVTAVAVFDRHDYVAALQKPVLRPCSRCCRCYLSDDASRSESPMPRAPGSNWMRSFSWMRHVYSHMHAVRRANCLKHKFRGEGRYDIRYSFEIVARGCALIDEASSRET